MTLKFKIFWCIDIGLLLLITILCIINYRDSKEYDKKIDYIYKEITILEGNTEDINTKVSNIESIFNGLDVVSLREIE